MVTTQCAACAVEAVNIQLHDCTVYSIISVDKLLREALKCAKSVQDTVVHRLVSAMFTGLAACVRNGPWAAFTAKSGCRDHNKRCVDYHNCMSSCRQVGFG